MAEDRVPTPVLNRDALDIIRAIRADGAGIGNQALDVLLRRHDALESSLGMLLETLRRGEAIPVQMQDYVAALLFQGKPHDGQGQDTQGGRQVHDDDAHEGRGLQ